ncbi:P-loop containing nucleoside triphosphate hydrolase protein, partial [Sarocladium strictum]
RVILRKPSIVILDEATSAVDSATEVSVQKALRALSKGRTVFVVAHRLSTIVKADQILLMDEGCVAESGTHEELLRANGRYHRLWHMQTVVGET